MTKIVFSREENEQRYPPQQRINLLPLLRTGKRKALFIACLTALVASMYTYVTKRNSASTYAGSFQILVEPLTLEAKTSEPSTLINSNGVPNDKVSAMDYPTMLRILTSRDILSEIARDVRAEYSDFGIDRLAENLTVERIQDGKSRFDASKILAVSYAGQDPQLVQSVLETTAQKYLDYSLSSRKQEIEQGLQFIEQQLPELNREVDRNLNNIQELQERYRIVEIDAKGESLLSKLQEIEFQQAETAKEIEELTQIRNNLQSKLNITADEAIAISALRENPNYQTLLQRLKNKESDLAIASARFNSNTPQVSNLQEEKQEILNLLNSEKRKILVNDNISNRVDRFLVSSGENSILSNLVKQLVETENGIETLQARQQALARNASLFAEQTERFPEISRRYRELQQELEIANRTREQLLVQKDRLQIQASQTQSPWTLVAMPQVQSDNAGNPQPLPGDSGTIILKGLFIGLLLSTGTAILIEKIRDIFYAAEDIGDMVNSAAIVGEIPFNPTLVKTQEQEINTRSRLESFLRYLLNIELLNIGRSNNKQSDFLNAFDKLYANTYLRNRARSIRSLVVCSPSNREGKSTVALYLAKAIAARGEKVLLIDANSFDYQLPDKLVSATQVGENLFVLIASRQILNNSTQREQLMAEFQANYDRVIYDTPSLLDSVTASCLSVNTDGILLVTAIGKTKKSLFVKAFEQIEALQLPLLGIVANHIGFETSDSYEPESLSNLDATKLFDLSHATYTLESQTNQDRQAENSSAENGQKGIESSNKN